MKKSFVFIVVCLFTSSLVSAASKYWVGPVNGNWNNAANWSATSGGSGGAGIPGVADDVMFEKLAKVKMDISPTITSLTTNNGTVLLYTSTPTTITILGSLYISQYSTLKDSTAASVPFNVYFKSGSKGTIYGTWIFEGGVPLTTIDNPGATFTAAAGSLVTVGYATTFTPIGGYIICKKNSQEIVSTKATLKFDNYSHFISDSKPIASIPIATWAVAVQIGSSSIPHLPAVIILTGTLSQVRHMSGIPDYSGLLVDLTNLTSDVSLGLPNGSLIRSNIQILNTNNHILTLLSPTSLGSSVKVQVGEPGNRFEGDLSISGSNTKVTLAQASFLAPATSYTLALNGSFNQSGGNFSLQDYNLATGTTTLEIHDNLIQTGGSFFTNSNPTSPLAKFRIIMSNPYFITGVSGLFESSRFIKMSSGTIDNGHNMVILRIDHTSKSIPGSSAHGVTLQSPLSVGRLELTNGQLNTSSANMLTVTDPSAAAVIVSSNNSYVNGPLRRATNSTQPYVFPTGNGNTEGNFVSDSCVVIPVSNTLSMYQAEYFKTAFSNLTVTSPLQGVSSAEYWNVVRISGSDARLALILNAAVPGASSLKGIVVARFAGASWITENGTVKTPGTSTTGTVTSKPLSIFNNFTFGYGVSNAFSSASLINGLTSSSNQNNANAQTGLTETIQTIEFGNLAKNAKERGETLSIYPNPFVESFSVDFYYNESKANASIDIYDMNGRWLYKQPINMLSQGYNRVSVNLAGKNLPAAVYSAQLNINGMPSKTVKMIKTK